MFRIGQTINEYKIKDKIGQTNIYQQFKALDSQGNYYALKLIAAYCYFDFQKTLTACKFQIHATHDNLLIAHELFFYKKRKYLVLVTDLYKYSLNEYQLNFGEIQKKDQRRYMQQIAKGMQFLHQNDIVHKSFDLANVKIGKNNEVRLNDFGLATEQTQTKRTLASNIQLYKAPQLFIQDKRNKESDVWAVGIGFLQILFGPKKLTGIQESVNKQLKFQLISQIQDYDIRILISQMLDDEPKKRPHFKEICKRLQLCSEIESKVYHVKDLQVEEERFQELIIKGINLQNFDGEKVDLSCFCYQKIKNCRISKLKSLLKLIGRSF